MNEEIEINESNFSQYFKNAKIHKPQKGEVLVRYQSTAEFVDGAAKRDIIKLLKINKGLQCASLMEKIHGAKEPWNYRVPLQMAKDLLIMLEEEVEKKPYKMVIEHLFWTKKEFVPKDDPKWQLIELTKYSSESGELY